MWQWKEKNYTIQSYIYLSFSLLCTSFVSHILKHNAGLFSLQPITSTEIKFNSELRLIEFFWQKYNLDYYASSTWYFKKRANVIKLNNWKFWIFSCWNNFVQFRGHIWQRIISMMYALVVKANHSISRRQILLLLRSFISNFSPLLGSIGLFARREIDRSKFVCWRNHCFRLFNSLTLRTTVLITWRSSELTLNLLVKK